jgi:predicted metal-dependent hydrolase
MSYKIVKSDRKSIALHISSNGELVVRAPNSYPNNLIMDFVNSKRNWIKQKQEQVSERLEITAKNDLKHGGEIPFLGDFYKINVDSSIRQTVIFDNAFFFKSHEIIKYVLLKWYKREAQNIIPGIAECEARKFGFDIAEIKINSARKRWGSCTSRKNINFSWRLVLLPEEVIHYVVIHELAHLVELNHSKKFWATVEKLLPNYKLYEKWMKKNSFKYSIDL